MKTLVYIVSLLLLWAPLPGPAAESGAGDILIRMPPLPDDHPMKGVRVPDYYPFILSRAGVFESVSSDRRSIRISTRRYPLSSQVRVYSLHSAYSSLSMLKKDGHIGFELSDDARGTPVVTTIWRLPDGVVRSDSDMYSLRIR